MYRTFQKKELEKETVLTVIPNKSSEVETRNSGRTNRLLSFDATPTA
jgi:hypothetical protein